MVAIPSPTYTVAPAEVQPLQLVVVPVAGLFPWRRMETEPSLLKLVVFSLQTAVRLQTQLPTEEVVVPVDRFVCLVRASPIMEPSGQKEPSLHLEEAEAVAGLLSITLIIWLRAP